MKTRKSPYAKFKQKWKDCQKCGLHGGRSKTVLGSGKLPCDVLFIGEAPGISEDVLGRPFVGPAGKLLDRMIRDSGLDAFAVAKTNLIACVPKDGEGNKVHTPDKKDIVACTDRLSEFIGLCDPRVIVTVGKLAKGHVKGVVEKEYNIIHPAAILRLDVSQKGLAIQRCVATLREVEDDINKQRIFPIRKLKKKILRRKK